MYGTFAECGLDLDEMPFCGGDRPCATSSRTSASTPRASRPPARRRPAAASSSTRTPPPGVRVAASHAARTSARAGDRARMGLVAHGRTEPQPMHDTLSRAAGSSVTGNSVASGFVVKIGHPRHPHQSADTTSVPTLRDADGTTTRSSLASRPNPRRPRSQRDDDAAMRSWRSRGQARA